MPEAKSTKKPVETRAAGAPGAKDKREFDAELSSLIDGLRLAPSQPAEGGAEQPGQTLNVQPPAPELVSRLVKFIKKI